MRCPELSRLAKPPRWSYIKFNCKGPGSPPNSASPKFTDPLDPTHPAARSNRFAFPSFEHDAFKLYAYPPAVLSGNPPKPLQLPSALDPVPDNKKHINMRMSTITSIKNTSKSAVVRVQINRRIKHSLELIIARGAKADIVKEWLRGTKIRRRGIVFDDNEARKMGPRWVLNGWMYVCIPKLPVHRMPYYELVTLLRWALQTLHAHGMYLEHRWIKILSKPPPDTRHRVF